MGNIHPITDWEDPVIRELGANISTPHWKERGPLARVN